MNNRQTKKANVEVELENENEESEDRQNCDCSSKAVIINSTYDIECTLAIIKPEVVVNSRAIENVIIEEGFTILQTRLLQMTPEQISEFYADSNETMNLANVVVYMTSGPIVVHILAKKQAVQEWLLLMGPHKVTLSIHSISNYRFMVSNLVRIWAKSASIHSILSYSI